MLVASAPSSSSLGGLTVCTRLHGATASSWLLHRSFAASAGAKTQHDDRCGLALWGRAVGYALASVSSRLAVPVSRWHRMGWHTRCKRYVDRMRKP